MSEKVETIPASNTLVKKQIQLPFRKAWEISLRGIKIRLGRSFITASGIVLGIAFFSSVRSAGLFGVDPTNAEGLAAMHRQQWLAVMALLVCYVGITNAMLMSVTERFKEIGTMKCLGALDSFVVKLFFIEAGLMGSIASFIGWLAGWGIIVVIHLFSDGWRIFTGSFLTRSLTEMVVSTLIGLVITLVAAIPPAVRAAQMPPAMALRSSI